MLGTATITGILHGPDGALVQGATLEITLKPPYFAATQQGGRLPLGLSGETDLEGRIGRQSEGEFAEGLVLSLGQYSLAVTTPSGSFHATLTVDENMIAAGAADLRDTLDPAPAPRVVTAAQEARDAAQTAQAAAEMAHAASVAARDKAQNWAENPEDVEVETGKFSALHHAAKAAASAASASGIETSAANSAAAAATSASAASADAASASTASTEAQAAQAAAETARDAAEGHKDAAAQDRTATESALVDAQAARDAASGHRLNAQNAATEAQGWAESPEDIEVETGKFSALHHAAKAAASAASASGIETSAASSAAAAESSAQTAVNSAVAAETSEGNAAVFASDAAAARDEVQATLAGISSMSGWSPVFAAVTDGERRVLQVTDWTGGDGDKPATGQYVGQTGLVATVAEGLDVRGPQGAAGFDGADGTNVTITVAADQAAFDAATPGATELVVRHA